MVLQPKPSRLSVSIGLRMPSQPLRLLLLRALCLAVVWHCWLLVNKLLRLWIGRKASKMSLGKTTLLVCRLCNMRYQSQPVR